MATTTLTSLAGNIFAEEALIAATLAAAPVKAFAHRFMESEREKGATITVPVFAVKEAQDFDGDYTKNADTADGTKIPLEKHLFDSKVYTDTDFAQCPVAFWKGAGKAVGKSVGLGICKTVTDLITTEKLTGQGGSFNPTTGTKKTLAALTEKCEANNFNPAESILLCSGAMYTQILSLMDAHVYGGPEAIRHALLPEGLYGFKQIVRCPTLTVNGAVVHCDAIGYGGTLLEPQSKSILEEFGYVQDEASGLTIGIRRFGEAKSGKNYIVGECLFGAKLVQPSKGFIVSAS
jgi:hypothetical protein